MDIFLGHNEDNFLKFLTRAFVNICYFEMYKITYGYMYFYTFFNNNAMHLIVLLLKIKQLKEETSVI